MEATRTEPRRVNGQEIFIRHWGDENLPPLLMLHGFPEYGGAWRDLAPLLCQHFHCIAPDQRGYGQSSAPEGIEPYAMAHLMADMAAFAHSGDDYAPAYPGQNIQRPAKGLAQTVCQAVQSLGFDGKHAFC